MQEKQSTYKQFRAHEKAFNEGMEQYSQGCAVPIDKNTPQWYGWVAAFEMASVKRRWLDTSRRHFKVD